MYISASSLNSNRAIDFASLCMYLCVCASKCIAFLSMSQLLFIERLCSDTTKLDLIGNPW